MFRVEPLLSHGTDNPITVRILLQFAEILDAGFVEIPDSTRNKVKELLFELMKDLLLIQDAATAIDKREEVATERLSAPGGISRAGTLVTLADNPNPELRKLFDDGIIRAGIAIRRFRKIAGLVSGKDFKKGDSVYRHVKDTLLSDDANLEWIEKDNARLKEIMDIRGAVEHEDLHVEPFEVIEPLSDTPHFAAQRFAGAKTSDTLRKTAEDLFGMMENTLALLIQFRLPKGVFVRQISDEESKSSLGARYALGIDLPPPIA